MIEFITGQAGSGKTTYMLEKIKQEACESVCQCILVPEQYSYEFDKTLYFYLGAEKFNELSSLSFTSLARQLFQLYGEPDRNGEYADELARMILIYQSISAVQSSPDSLNYFRRQSTYNGFAEEVLKLINDLKRSGIDSQELLNKSVMLDKRLKDKTIDIAAIYLEYERLMKEYGFKDNLDNIKEAAKTANLHQYFKGQSVYIDEFESFTGDQLEMLRVIISSAENVCITLRTDDVNAGEYTLFETVNNTYRKITDICREFNKEYKNTVMGRSYRFRSSDLEYLSSHIMRNFRYTPEEAPKAENIHIFEARDMYSEIEYVCASIKRLIFNDKNLKYRDIAIISNDIARYADILGAAFERYDIPYFLSIERSVNHTSVMVFFTSLLDILTAKKIRSEQIFRILKCGILDISLTDVSILENYCYKWGVDNELWNEPFTAPDDNLELLETLRNTITVPLMKLKKRLNRKNSAAKICTLLYDYLVECEAEKSVGRLMNSLIRQNRDYEAAEIKRLWGCLIDILDSINDTLGENTISFSETARIMKSMIGKIKYSVPPQTLDSVIAASARTARLNSPKVVFVIGSNDGDFPNQVNIHGLFSESDKLKLSHNGIDISRPVSDLIASERLVVYKAISAASDKLFVTYPLSDLSGQAKYPAQVVDMIMKMFGSTGLRTSEDEIPPHYYAVTMRSAFYHYMQDKTLNNTSVASIKRLLLSEPEFKRRLAYVLSRSDFSQNYTIDRDVMQKLKSFNPLRLSSTGLEDYNLCHFKYFCNHCLRLQVNEKVELDARIAGDLTHECLHGILAARSKEDFINMSYDELSGEIKKYAHKYREKKLAGDFGKNAKFDLVYNKLTERLSTVFLHTQQSLMASDFIPNAYEVKLRNEHSVVLPFGDGYKLSFGGIIDRVDSCSIGDKKYIRIFDYKSSRKNITPLTLAGGINLQMLLYLFASTETGGLYEGYEPAGVLYSPVQISDIKLEKHRINTINSTALKSSLKTSGLILSDIEVLEAMEKNISGNFIPARLNKNGSIDEKSSCISAEGMKQLKDYTYKKLTEMAESLLMGNAEAVPLINGNNTPCSFCNYGDICDNSLMTRYRTADETSISEAEKILSLKADKKQEE